MFKKSSIITLIVLTTTYLILTTGCTAKQVFGVVGATAGVAAGFYLGGGDVSDIGDWWLSGEDAGMFVGGITGEMVGETIGENLEAPYVSGDNDDEDTTKRNY
jgi:hypothetical protein